MAKDDPTKTAQQPDPDALAKALAKLDELTKAVAAGNEKTAALEEENKRLRGELASGKTTPAPAVPTPRVRGIQPGELVPGRVVHYMKPLPLVVPLNESVPRSPDPKRQEVLDRRELAPQAAIVINVHEDDSADLKVFFTNGAEHTLKRVPFATEPTKGAWCWPQRT